MVVVEHDVTMQGDMHEVLRNCMGMAGVGTFFPEVDERVAPPLSCAMLFSNRMLGSLYMYKYKWDDSDADVAAPLLP